MANVKSLNKKYCKLKVNEIHLQRLIEKTDKY